MAFMVLIDEMQKKMLIIIKRRRNISLIEFANYAGKMLVVGDI